MTPSFRQCVSVKLKEQYLQMSRTTDSKYRPPGILKAQLTTNMLEKYSIYELRKIITKGTSTAKVELFYKRRSMSGSYSKFMNYAMNIIIIKKCSSLNVHILSTNTAIQGDMRNLYTMISSYYTGKTKYKTQVQFFYYNY